MPLIALYTKLCFTLKKEKTKRPKTQQPDIMDKSVCFYYSSLAVFMEINYSH